MGTYSDEDPNAGVGERLVNSIKKITGLDKDPTKKEPVNPDTGHTAQEEADAQTSSNTGAAGQSTDAYNKY